MTTIAVALLIPLLGTMLGSAFVFLMKGAMPDGCKNRCWDLHRG